MSAAAIAFRKAVISSGSSGLPFHWLAFLVKTCNASHPWRRARSTALDTPPATDMWAPIRIDATSVADEKGLMIDQSQHWRIGFTRNLSMFGLVNVQSIVVRRFRFEPRGAGVRHEVEVD